MNHDDIIKIHKNLTRLFTGRDPDAVKRPMTDDEVDAAIAAAHSPARRAALRASLLFDALAEGLDELAWSAALVINRMLRRDASASRDA